MEEGPITNPLHRLREPEEEDRPMPTGPWPDKQAARLDRLLKYLADEANHAQLAAMYEPSSWAADRLERLIRDLWRQADNARQEGPGEPEPEPSHEVKGRNLTFTMDALGYPTKPTS